MPRGPKQKSSLTGRAVSSLDGLSRGPLSIAAEPSPLEILQAAELRDWVNRLVAGLNRCQRAVILLHYFSDLPWHEIGVMLHATEDACRMRHARALRTLRAKAEKQGVSRASQVL